MTEATFYRDSAYGGLAIYPGLAFYFFPWSSFRNAMKRRAKR